MDVFKKHYETLTILGGMVVAIVSCCIWINGKFTSIDEKFTAIDEKFTAANSRIEQRLNEKFTAIDEKFTAANSRIEQRLIRIETVLIMQGVMPKELAAKKEPSPGTNG